MSINSEEVELPQHYDDVLEPSDENTSKSPLEPYIGMEFDDIEDVHIFYNAYAKRTGFGIRRNYTRLAKEDRSLVGIEYVCSKEGFRCQGTKRKCRTKPEIAETRCGCRAMMGLKKVGQTWDVIKFIIEHNLDLLTPKSTSLLRGHRGVSRAKKKLIDTLNESGVPTRKILSVLSKESGGDYNMYCIGKDIEYYVGSKRRNLLKDGDAKRMQIFFIDKQGQDPGFFYTIKLDDNGCMANSRSRAAYQYFGDVVTFDATYLTNRYGMPFVPFIGVNHHHQSVMFGCALLTNKTATSYIWLLKTWLVAMLGWAPTVILTDDDNAMGKAITEVLPNTVHRLCLWHILQKIPEHLSHVYNRYPQFQVEFRHCIHETVTIQEFEFEWSKIIVKYDLEDNQWLSNLYMRRDKWVPAYLRIIFFAGMATTQRSESMNKFFKDYVRSSTMVSDFVLQYDEALNARYLKEKEQDVKIKNSKPIMKTSYRLEVEAAKIYTRKSFAIFQEKLFNSTTFKASKYREDEGKKIYNVTLYGKENPVYEVSLDILDKKAICSCHMFEFIGIICRHIVHIFAKKALADNLPAHFILERWTINAKSRILSGLPNIECVVPTVFSCVEMRNKLMGQLFDIVDVGSQSMKRYEHSSLSLQKLYQELLIIDGGTSNVDVRSFDSSAINSQVQSNFMVTVQDPPYVATKGKPKSLRQKNPNEKSSAKKRKCSICKITGHIKRTCLSVSQGRDNVDLNLRVADLGATQLSNIPTSEYFVPMY